MSLNKNYDEPILQSERFNMSTGATARIQIKESCYVLILNFDTDMYKNLRMNSFKKGLRISSTLKKFPKKKKSNEINLTRDFTDFSQLTEDNISIEEKDYKMNIVVRLMDFMRPNVKKACTKYLLQQKMDCIESTFE